MKRKVNDIINMYFATHKTCNMNCKYCYVPDYNRFSKKVNDVDIFNSLRDFIKKAENENYAIGSFCFHGSEASLMSAETLGQAILLVKEHWKKNGLENLTTAIQTNGKNFTNEYLQDLQKIVTNKDLRIGFSIDPPAQVHNLLRDNSYELIKKNFENAINLGFEVSVLSVVSKETMKYFIEFENWMKYQLKRNRVDGNPYKIKIKFATGEMGLSNEEIIDFSKFLIEKDLLSLPQMLTPGYCIQSGNECMWFEFDIDGNCYSCNKTYHEEGIFADWKSMSFKKIFEIRRNLYNLEFCNDECSGCEYEFLCNSGCPVDRWKHGEMRGKAHECSLIKEAFGHIINNSNMDIIEFYNKNI